MDYSSQIKDQFKYLHDGDLEKIQEIAVYKTLAKRERLIEAGSSLPCVALVLRGIIRGYFLDQHGVERTIFLTHENLFVGAPEAVFYQQPTRYTFEAEIDSEVLIFNSQALIELGLGNPRIGRMVIDGLSEVIKILIGRLEAMIEMLPESRFEDLVRKRPAFCKAALDKHLAHYLGISPVSFSRIKKRQSDKN